MNLFTKLRRFCRVLKGDRNWRLTSNGLRTYVKDEGDCCPLTYASFMMTGYRLPVCEYRRAAEWFGFDDKDAEIIAGVADMFERPNPRNSTDRKLGRILARACGIPRPQPPTQRIDSYV